MKPVVAACILLILGPGVCLAQFSMGTSTGVVRDPSGGVLAEAPVHAVSRATGQVRMTTTTERGEYSFPALLPGEYEISVEAVGFQRIARAATVEAGTTTRADFVLRVGDLSDSVTVQAALPQIHYDLAAVGGVILFGEALSARLVIAGFLVLGGIALAILGSRR